MSRALTFLFFTVLLLPSLRAQDEGITGIYQRADRPEVTVEIEQVSLIPPIFVGTVRVGDTVIEGETMVMVPDGDEMFWRNRNGNEGVLREGDEHDLESEVTTGPNTGTKFQWDKI